jgi:hypothetical protein
VWALLVSALSIQGYRELGRQLCDSDHTAGGPFPPVEGGQWLYQLSGRSFPTLSAEKNGKDGARGITETMKML